MTPPPIELQRLVAVERARVRGIPLVTPDTFSATREAVAAVASLISSRSYAEVTAGTSFYVPRLAGEVLALLPASVTSVLRVATFDLPKTGAIYVSREAWDKHPAAVVAHEIGHGQQDAVVSARGPVISALWALGVTVHRTVTGWEEGRCRVNDLVGLVVIDGVDIDAALASARAGADAYALDAPGRELYFAALDSAAASLRAGELPGEGTEIHHVLKALSREWDAGPWAAAIDGERKTVTP